MDYVQITWEENYVKASCELGVDFLSNLKLLLEHKYAAPTIIAGMIEGWFTGDIPTMSGPTILLRIGRTMAGKSAC